MSGLKKPYIFFLGDASHLVRNDWTATFRIYVDRAAAKIFITIIEMAVCYTDAHHRAKPKLHHPQALENAFTISEEFIWIYLETIDMQSIRYQFV